MKKLSSLLLVLGIGLQAGEAGSARDSFSALNGASPSIEGFLSVGEVQSFFLDLKQPQNIQKPQIHCHLCSFKGTEKWHMELHMQEHAAEALEDDMGEAFINQNGHVAIRDSAGDIVFEELPRDMGEAFINRNGHVEITDGAGDIVFEELDGSSLQ